MKFDFSIIPSYECNLQCWFCMYECSPYNHKELDYAQTKKFLETVNWLDIASFGFYGGEMSINLPMYQKFIDLIPEWIPKFAITNGAWSKDTFQTVKMFDFIRKNNLRVKVSNTPDHRRYQDIRLLDRLEKHTNGQIYVKANDDTKGRLLSMGRLSHLPVECTKRCNNLSAPMNGNEKVCRMALEPSGDIILQSCDGRYPVVGNYQMTFEQVINLYHSLKCPYNV